MTYPVPPSKFTEGVTLQDIADQRDRGWPDFGPESFCHRCGRPNVTSWHVDSELWNAAVRKPDGTPIDGYPNSEIICLPCFTKAYDALGGEGYYCVWELKLVIP